MRKIFIAVGVVTILVGILYAGRAWNSLRVNARTAQFNNDVEDLFTALQKFKERVGSYPTGGNLEVSKALQGANSKNVIVIVGSAHKNNVNDKGEFIDPWGTPLRIYFSDSGVLIRSAGPNRRFDDSTVIDADDFIRSN
jgi:type II secretory pathway pseudopilin PulG